MYIAHNNQYSRLPAISGTNKQHAKIVRSMVLRDSLSDPIYQLRKNACAFLQGYDDHTGWFLVEFWTDSAESYQPFIDEFNKQIQEMK